MTSLNTGEKQQDQFKATSLIISLIFNEIFQTTYNNKRKHFNFEQLQYALLRAPLPILAEYKIE